MPFSFICCAACFSFSLRALAASAAFLRSLPRAKAGEAIATNGVEDINATRELLYGWVGKGVGGAWGRLAEKRKEEGEVGCVSKLTDERFHGLEVTGWTSP